MTNNEHAKELEAQAMMYPQGDVFDALMAGAAALGLLTTAENHNKELTAALEVARLERDEAILWKAEYIRQVAEKDEQVAEVHSLLFKAEAALATPGPTIGEWKAAGAAEELERLRDHIQEYIGPDDARDEIRRICASRALDLRAEAARLRGGGE